MTETEWFLSILLNQTGVASEGDKSSANNSVILKPKIQVKGVFLLEK